MKVMREERGETRLTTDPFDEVVSRTCDRDLKQGLWMSARTSNGSKELKLTLIGDPKHPDSLKARITAKLCGLKLYTSEGTESDIWFGKLPALKIYGNGDEVGSDVSSTVAEATVSNSSGGSPCSSQDLQSDFKSASKSSPALVFGGNAIARCIARLATTGVSDGKYSILPQKGGIDPARLCGTTMLEQGYIDSFLDLVSKMEVLLQPWLCIGQTTMAQTKSENKVLTEKDIGQWVRAQTSKRKSLEWLHGFDNTLQTRSFLARTGFSIADVCLFCALILPFQHLLDKLLRQKLPWLTTWFSRLAARPQIAAVVGTISMAQLSPVISNASQQLAVSQNFLRWHRIATIQYESHVIRLKLYEDTEPQAIQNAIRARFQVRSDQTILLVDEEGCDVVPDGNLETATYKLQVLNPSESSPHFSS